MFDWLIDWLEALAQKVDPALFVFIGSFVEEIVAPIPSPLIMATTAALAHSLQLPWMEILWILAVAAGSKTLSSLLVYWVADKSEDILIGKFGGYVGLSTAMIEGVGRWVGKGYWDDLVLLLMRSLPIVPSIVVSAACGVFKINLRTYLWTTFVGTFIRNGIFFSILYFGWGQAEAAWNFLDERGELLALAAIVLAGAVWLAWHMKNRIESKVLGTGGKTDPRGVSQIDG
jgi:membrane protein DedA with SNARE-associated domain